MKKEFNVLLIIFHLVLLQQWYLSSAPFLNCVSLVLPKQADKQGIYNMDMFMDIQSAGN